MVTHFRPLKQEVVHCPYCVNGDRFREMIGDGTGRFLCAACGHQVRLNEPDYWCSCENCRLLNPAAS